MENSPFTEEQVARNRIPVYIKQDTINTLSRRPIMQTGWGYMKGVAANNMEGNVSFPSPFPITPVSFQISQLGIKTSIPTSISDFDSTTTPFAAVSAYNINHLGFVFTLATLDGTNFDTSAYYGFSWLAIGVRG